MPVTIRDITKRLDVSVGAVSRALNGYTDITDDTRHWIEDSQVYGMILNRMQVLGPERVLVGASANLLTFFLPNPKRQRHNLLRPDFL